MAAKKAGIPVLLIDRSVDPSLAKAGEDYLAFVGSNFIQEGQRVAEWTIKTKTGGKGKIIELEGTIGASPGQRPQERLRRCDQGQGARAWQSSPASPATSLATRAGRSPRPCSRPIADATIVYAHNDEMALGAIAAIEAAGKVPGKDILVVSIDGEKDAVQAIIDGKMGCDLRVQPALRTQGFRHHVQVRRRREDRAGHHQPGPVLRRHQRQRDAGDRVLTVRQIGPASPKPLPPAVNAGGRGSR